MRDFARPLCYVARMLTGVLVFVVLSVVGAAAAAVYARRTARTLAQLTRTPVVSIESLGSLADGAVARVTGTVSAAGKPEMAPYSGRECLAAIYERWALGTSGKQRVFGAGVIAAN